MPRKYSPFLLLVASIVFGLFFMEGVLRLGKPDYEFAVWYSNSLTYLLDEHVDWKLEPKTYSLGRINRFYFRGKEVAKSKPAGVFRVAIIGGSAAFDLWKPDEKTWTLQLEADLNAGFPVRAEVLNAATPGYSSWQAYNLVRTRLLEWHPDVVLLYELYNDSLTFSHNNRSEIIAGWKLNGRANYIGWAAHPDTILDPVSGFLPHTMDVFRMTLLRIMKSRSASENDRFWSNPNLDWHLQEGGFAFYEENRRNLARFLKKNNIPLGIVTQVSMIREENTPEEQTRIHYVYRGLPKRELWIGYRRARDIDRKICAEESNAFLIPAHEMVPANFSTMIDEVHLNDEGGRLLAATVADALIARYGK